MCFYHDEHGPMWAEIKGADMSYPRLVEALVLPGAYSGHRNIIIITVYMHVKSQD